MYVWGRTFLTPAEIPEWPSYLRPKSVGWESLRGGNVLLPSGRFGSPGYLDHWGDDIIRITPPPPCRAGRGGGGFRGDTEKVLYLLWEITRLCWQNGKHTRGDQHIGDRSKTRHTHARCTCRPATTNLSPICWSTRVRLPFYQKRRVITHQKNYFLHPPKSSPQAQLCPRAHACPFLLLWDGRRPVL